MIQELSVLRIGNYLMDKGGIVRVVDIPCEKKGAGGVGEKSEGCSFDCGVTGKVRV